jgi:hypothetical protein
LNTNVINAVTRQNFWKRVATKISTFAKNVEVRICRNYFQGFLLDKAAVGTIPAQPERVPLERVDSDRKGCYGKARIKILDS